VAETQQAGETQVTQRTQAGRCHPESEADPENGRNRRERQKSMVRRGTRHQAGRQAEAESVPAGRRGAGQAGRCAENGVQVICARQAGRCRQASSMQNCGRQRGTQKTRQKR